MTATRADLAELTGQRPQLNVLVVEDEQLLADCMKAILTDAGYTVQTASNGLDGLSKFQSNHFDVVFSDYVMPYMCGGEMAEQIKFISPKTPVIIVTAYLNLPVMKEGGAKSVDFLMGKPFQRTELLDAIKKYLD